MCIWLPSVLSQHHVAKVNRLTVGNNISRKCLRPLLSAPSERSHDISLLFDQQLFLKHSPTADSAFFSHFFDTQIFTAFIEQRSFAHTENTALAFFDECAEKVHVRVYCTYIDILTTWNVFELCWETADSCMQLISIIYIFFLSRFVRTLTLSYWTLQPLSASKHITERGTCSL